MSLSHKEAVELIELVQRRCEESGQADLVKKLDAAQQVGSSGLEAWGAIGAVFRSDRERIASLVGGDKVDAMIRHVKKVHGDPSP